MARHHHALQIAKVFLPNNIFYYVILFDCCTDDYAAIGKRIKNASVQITNAILKASNVDEVMHVSVFSYLNGRFGFILHH